MSFLRFYLFLERVEGREKKRRETSMCGCLSCAPYWGPGPQPRHVPWWELNWWPFGSQAGTQSTEPHQPGAQLFVSFLSLKKIFLKILFIYFIREEGREKEKERNSNVWELHGSAASRTPPSRDLACNPGMCPDWESNQWLFGSQAGTESIEPHQPGLKKFFY